MPEFLLALPRLGELIDGKYRVVDYIGAGSMGAVFRAVDERLQRDVAVKVLKPEWSRLQGLRDAFLHEAQALASARHDNVVELFDVGEHLDLPFFVMAYMAGPTLRRYIEQRGAGGLSFDEALGLVDQICQGVAQIHDAGLVHGDLKPENILTDKNYRVAVSDLGLAGLSVLCQDEDVPLLAGTRGYTAPEVGALRELGARDNALAKRRDVWAIGAIAYELLTGRPLVRGGLRGPELTGLRPDLPEAICEAVELALIENPVDRTASATRLRQALWDARPKRLRGPSEGELVASKRHVVQEATPVTVVMVDDDADFLALNRVHVQAEFPGARVLATTDPHEALREVRAQPSLLITDLDMPVLDGVDVTKAARAHDDAMVIVVITGNGSADHWRRLRQLGADACLLKPTDADTLGAVLRAQAERARVRIGV